MKPIRTNKIRSITSFIQWLITYKLRCLAPQVFGADPIKLEQLNAEELQRVSYYCKLTDQFMVTDGVSIAELPYFKKTGYSFDLHRVMAPFKHLRFHYLPGDIKHVPEVPSVVRSRPISDVNQNSILLPLNSRRLFEVYEDPKTFEDKKPIIAWRGAVHKEHRALLLEAAAKLPFCDIAASATSIERCKPYVKNWLTPAQQMECKYLFVIEGNDIASNIQWAMNSNSLCFMKRPKYESWFAEGLLVADVHYVEINEDYSNIEEKFNYYEANPEEAKKIIKNSNEYVKKFKNLNRQYAMGRIAMEKYFRHASQIK